MAISLHHRFIYVKINKTGGTAIQRRLAALAPDLAEKGHLVLSDHRVELDGFYKFSFVRNPWDKMVSFYAYHRKRGFDLLPQEQSKGAGRWLPALWRAKRTEPSFRDFMLVHLPWLQFRNTCGGSSTGLRTGNQLDWLTDGEGRVAMDFIGRFETLQRDFDTVCTRMGFPVQRLSVVNPSAHGRYTTYYDEETKYAVAQAFAKDIEYFGYRFGD